MFWVVTTFTTCFSAVRVEGRLPCCGYVYSFSPIFLPFPFVIVLYDFGFLVVKSPAIIVVVNGMISWIGIRKIEH